MISKLTGVMQAERMQRWINRPNHQLVTGVVHSSGRIIWMNGDVVSEDHLPAASIYEIGSISKTFVGLLLAIGEENGLWRSTDRLSELVPEWESSPFAQTTTLLQLVTHTSGLPRLPNNIKKTVRNKRDPYANYSEHDLIQAVLGEVPREKRSFSYSNYGFGLLGFILAKQLGKSLHNAMSEFVFNPLQMKGSGFTIEQTERKIPVYNAKGAPTPHWQFQDCTAGAGGICSTVQDMLQYLEAQLGLHGQSETEVVARPRNMDTAMTRPENIIASIKPAENIAAALAQSQKEHVAIRRRGGIGIGYGWLRYDEKDGSTTHWHNGGTFGSSSFASFNRDHGIGLIILSNYGVNLRSNLPLVGARLLNVDKLAKQLTDVILKR